MNLLRLPMELQLAIARYALPYGFESLVITCKQLHYSLQSLLKRHNELRKKYRNFRGHEADDRSDSIFDLLVEITEHPIIADYIVYLDLEDFDWHNVFEPDEKCFLEMSQRISSLVLASRHLAMLSDGKDELGAKWLHETVRYTLGFAGFEGSNFGVGFLLSLLSNVKSISMPYCWDGYASHETGPEYPIASLLELLIRRANDKTLTNEPLQKLRTISATHETYAHYNDAMEQVVPFMALNSLQDVHYSSNLLDNRRHRELMLGHLGCNIETLELEQINTSGLPATDIFQHMRKLRRLAINDVNVRSADSAFDADLFICGVQRCTFGTLESFVLTARVPPKYTTGISSSLRGFIRLKHLELSTAFLANVAARLAQPIAPDDAPDTSEVLEASKQEDIGADENRPIQQNTDYEGDVSTAAYEYHPDDDIERYTSGKAIWRLASVLPASIETLVLHMPAEGHHIACVEQMFCRFEQLRAGRFPLLKKIKIHVYMRCPLHGNLLEGAEAHVEQVRAIFASTGIVARFQIHEKQESLRRRF